MGPAKYGGGELAEEENIYRWWSAKQNKTECVYRGIQYVLIIRVGILVEN